MMDLPQETVYDETILSASAQCVRERNARKRKPNGKWQNKCQHVMEMGIMCVDESWLIAYQKCSLWYMAKPTFNGGYVRILDTRARDTYQGCVHRKSHSHRNTLIIIKANVRTQVGRHSRL